MRWLTPAVRPGILMRVTGKRLLKRFVAVFLGALCFLVFLNAVESHAVDVRGAISLTVCHPDRSEAERRNQRFAFFATSLVAAIEAQSAFSPCPQRLKAVLPNNAGMARLKSCPDTTQLA